MYKLIDWKFYETREIPMQNILDILNSTSKTCCARQSEYLLVKLQDKKLWNWCYNHNWYTYFKYDAALRFNSDKKINGYHLPTIQEMKDVFKWKTVNELQEEIWFVFSGYRGTDWDFNDEGNEENFWSCSPTSGKDNVHYYYLGRGDFSPSFNDGSREYSFRVLLFKDKSSD